MTHPIVSYLSLLSLPSCHASKLAVDALLDGFTGLKPEDYPDQTMRVIPDIFVTSPEFEEELISGFKELSEDEEIQAERANEVEARDEGVDDGGDEDEGGEDDDDTGDVPLVAEGDVGKEASVSKSAARKARLALAKEKRELWREKEKDSPIGKVRFSLVFP